MSKYEVRYWVGDYVSKTYPVDTLEEGMERVLEGPYDPEAASEDHDDETACSYSDEEGYGEDEDADLSAFAELIRNDTEDSHTCLFWRNDDCDCGSDLKENDPDYETVARMAGWNECFPDSREDSQTSEESIVLKLDGIVHKLTLKQAYSVINTLTAAVNKSEDYLSLKKGDVIYYADWESGTAEEGHVFSVRVKENEITGFSVEFADDFDEFNGNALGRSFFISRERAEEAAKRMHHEEDV